jgi:oxygen-independent coproporphyrinogen-3 oxidase
MMYSSPHSLYLHVPFCAAKCAYCDFYSVLSERALTARFSAAAAAQIRALRNIDAPYRTVYVGGGTPSVLSCEEMRVLLSEVRVAQGGEFTVELNPESVSTERLQMLKSCGVNRVSLGIQSLHDDVLRFLGRVHSADTARRAMDAIVRAGFENISADLMYAVPGKGADRWEAELREVMAMPISHLSVYSLTYERATPLFKDLEDARFTPVPESDDAAMYRQAQDVCESCGFMQYEISNFAKTGCFSRHNDNYWKNGAYRGIGPGAVEYVNGERRRRIGDIAAYCAAAERGEDLYDDRETLGAEESACETAILNLRSRDGIDFAVFAEKTGYDIRALRGDEIAALKRQGLLAVDDHGVRLTREGFCFYDRVAREMV